MLTPWLSVEVINLLLPERPTEADGGQHEPSTPPPPFPSGTPLFSLSVLLPDEDDRIPLALPQDHIYLYAALEKEMQDIYILYGTDGLDALETAIDLMHEQTDTAPFQERAQRAFAYERRKHEAQATKACEGLQPVAVTHALARLQASIDEVLNEATRYLTSMQTAEDAERLFRTAPLTWDFKTTSDRGEAEAMIRALLTLREMRMVTAIAQQREQDLLDALIRQGSTEAAAGTLTEGARQFLFKKQPTLAQARQRAEEAEEQLAQTLMGYCLEYPIIHRLVSSQFLPVYAEGTRYLLSAPRGQAERYGQFRREVYHTLRDVWQAASSLYEVIADDPEAVWDYPPLVEAALIALGESETSFISRAAEEKLKEARLKDWVERAAMIAGGAELLALMFSPAPPVAAAIAAVSAIFSVGSAALEGYEKYKQSRAAKAALDPTKSLSAEPSWGLFVVMTALDLINLRSVKWTNIAEAGLFRRLLAAG